MNANSLLVDWLIFFSPPCLNLILLFHMQMNELPLKTGNCPSIFLYSVLQLPQKLSILNLGFRQYVAAISHQTIGRGIKAGQDKIRDDSKLPFHESSSIHTECIYTGRENARALLQQRMGAEPRRKITFKKLLEKGFRKCFLI